MSPGYFSFYKYKYIFIYKYLIWAEGCIIYDIVYIHEYNQLSMLVIGANLYNHIEFDSIVNIAYYYHGN